MENFKKEMNDSLCEWVFRECLTEYSTSEFVSKESECQEKWGAFWTKKAVDPKGRSMKMWHVLLTSEQPVLNIMLGT